MHIILYEIQKLDHLSIKQVKAKPNSIKKKKKTYKKKKRNQIFLLNYEFHVKNLKKKVPFSGYDELGPS